MRWTDLIVSTPDTCHGQARFAGTRIPVSVVLDALAAGSTEPEVLAQYPTLRADHIRAAISYAASLSRESIIPLRTDAA